VLEQGERVRLTADTSSGDFWPVRTANDEAGWVHGRYLIPPTAVTRVLTTAAAFTTSYPSCGGEHHFRWAAKKSTAQENLTAIGATVTGMLNWAPRIDLGKDLASWCAARAGRELKQYRVSGWVRTIKKGEDDGDWHVELTSAQASAVANCIVVEIPNPSYASEFATARSDLTSLTNGSTLDDTGKLSPPVRLRFTGAAFDDGWHGPHGSMPSGHGHCNSTIGAVWEIHPVFKVEHP
jgi:hypothetical protein